MTRRDYIATILREHGESFADVEYVEPVNIDLDVEDDDLWDATVWTNGKIYLFRTRQEGQRDEDYIDINVVTRNPPDCG